LNRPESFEIHAHKSYVLGALTVNSWFRAKSGIMIGTDKARLPIILVEQDLNTVQQNLDTEPVKTAELGPSATDAFFRGCPEELDVILSLYFPDNP
jgi:hypothetical protein